MSELLEQICIKHAALLLHHADDIRFTPSFAIFAVTNNENLATEERSVKAVRIAKDTMCLTSTKIVDILERAHLIMKTAKCLPKIAKERSLADQLTFADFRPVKKASAMRMAGCKCEETLSSHGHSGARVKEFSRCHQARMKEGEGAPLPNPRCARPESHQLPPTIDVDESSTSPLSTISPMSSSQFSSQSSQDSHRTRSEVAAVSSQSSSKSLTSTFGRLTDLSVTRRTSKAAQDARAEEIACKDAHNAAMMAGSILLSQQRRGRLRLKKLNTAEKVAEEVNALFGFEVATGEDLNRAVRRGHAGKPPPPRGPPRSVADHDFHPLCELVCTCASIDQVNCNPNRLDRPRMRSVVSEVVNDFLETNEKSPIDGVAFCKRMEVELARDLKLKSPDHREALRAAWLTWKNQNKNYEQWEWWCLHLGFARHPENEEERQSHGNVVFDEDQRRRIIQFDEMGFSLDGKKNGKGGRPAEQPTNPILPDPGQPTNHSSQKASCLFGMNHACEAIPPTFVVSSDAKEPRLRSRFLLNMKQVKGRFGFGAIEEGEELRAFSVHVAFSPDGSVNHKIMVCFIEKHLHHLHPDVEDEPGKRVLLKADLGPGRWNELFRTVARNLGTHFFPGVPNGTEPGQEMDQLFSQLKTNMETNRERLWKARHEYECASAKTTTWDLPWLVFGGDVPSKNDASIELEDALNEGLNPARCERAMQKCGCIPAARVLLKSEKLVRVICDENGDDVGEGDDAHAKIVAAIERRNHEVVDELVERGFVLAGSLKRKVRRAPKGRHQNSVQDDVTAAPPCTKARQISLMHNRKGGTWFKATNGGAPLNCTDAIIAMIMEMMKERREKKERKRSDIRTRQKEIDAAKRVTDSKGDCYVAKPDKNCWTNEDLKAMIKWKVPDPNNTPTKKEGLVALWNEVQNVDPPPLSQWEETAEIDELSKFSCNGSYAIEKTSMMRKAERRRMERLSFQLAALQRKRALKLVGTFIQGLSEEDRGRLFNNWEDFSLEDDSSESSEGSVDDLDAAENDGTASWEVIAIQEEEERSVNEDSVEEDDNGDYGDHSSYLYEHDGVLRSVQESHVVEEDCRGVEDAQDPEALRPQTRRSRRKKAEETPKETPQVAIRRSARQRSRPKR